MNHNQPFSWSSLIIVFVLALALTGCTLAPASTRTAPVSVSPTSLPTASPFPTPYLGQQTDPSDQKQKLCGSIDQSDIIIELDFAPGVVKDTSYETGFYFSPIFSTMRLARRDCDYRVGFKFSEFIDKGQAQVGVRGYSDNRRRTLKQDPLSVSFDSSGNPGIGLPIKVTVLD